jgi:hypothetical protein
MSTTLIGTHEMKEYEGRINFTTNAWSSPNHWAFVAFSVHLEHNGMPLTFPLDVVEVAKVRETLAVEVIALNFWQSHTGFELALELERTLEEFGVIDKVSSLNNCDIATHQLVDIVYHL